MNTKVILIPGGILAAVFLTAFIGIGVSDLRKRQAEADVEENWDAYIAWQDKVYRQFGTNLLAGIVVADGINEFEARAIASVYHREHISMCGGTDWPPVLSENFWKCTTFTGFAGEPGPTFYIDRKNGDICSRQSMILPFTNLRMEHPPAMNLPGE